MLYFHILNNNNSNPLYDFDSGNNSFKLCKNSKACKFIKNYSILTLLHIYSKRKLLNLLVRI